MLAYSPLVVTLNGMRSPKNVPDATTPLNIRKALQDMSGFITQNGLKKRTSHRSKESVGFAKPYCRDQTMSHVT